MFGKTLIAGKQCYNFIAPSQDRGTAYCRCELGFLLLVDMIEGTFVFGMVLKNSNMELITLL